MLLEVAAAGVALSLLRPLGRGGSAGRFLLSRRALRGRRILLLLVGVLGGVGLTRLFGLLLAQLVQGLPLRSVRGFRHGGLLVLAD